MVGRHWKSLAIAVLLMAAFALKGLLLVPPAPHPGATFNAERAVSRLAAILGDQRPHPVDTPANDAVRERLIGELRALGLNPAVRTAGNCNGLPDSRTVSCSLTRNVVAIVGADRPGKALLLNAHYDSTPTGPGAADDGIGVATLLEVAANLRHRPLDRPLILLFNEGEEYGLNGAAAFAENDPLAAAVGSLINIESRGVSGPAWMFETDEPNGPAIADFAASSARPYANSLTADFAKLIPNYTDVLVFKKGRDWRTLSFAIVGNETRYHSPGDTVEALSRSSVQHMGDQVLAATRQIGSSERQGRTVYADIAGRFLFAAPRLPAAGLLLLLIGGTLFLAWRGKAIGRPMAAVAAAFAGGIVIAFAVSWFAGLIRAGDYWRAYPLIAFAAVYASQFAVMAAILGWIGGKMDRDRLRLACWLFVLVTGGALSLAMPGAMAFFLIAPAIGALGFMIPSARTALLWIAALAQLIMFAQLAASIEMLLIDGPLWAVAPIAAIAALPLLVEALPGSLRWPAIGLAALAVVLWAGAMLMPRSSADRPLAFTLDYVRDDLARKAWWTVASKQAPLPPSFGRTGQWNRTVLPYSGRTRWATAAPAIDIPAASVTKVSEFADGAGRTIRLRLDRGGADAIAIRLPANAQITAMGLTGSARTIEGGTHDEPYILRCAGRACDGLEVEIAFGGTTRVEGMVIAQRFALPPQGQPLARLRPANAHPQYGPDSSVRIVAVTL